VGNTLYLIGIFVMQLRSFILAGFCAALCLSAPAYAAMPATTASKAAAKTDVVKVAAKNPAAELKLLKKKKNPTDADLQRIGELEAQAQADKQAAYDKMIEAKKMAMREAAKAKAEKARQDFFAERDGGSGEPATEVAESKPVKPAAKKAVVEPVEPLKPIQQAEEDVSPAAMDVALKGNNGELRSEANDNQPQQSDGFFAEIFGSSAPAASVSYLPETRALDSILAKKDAKKPFKVKPDFMPQEVSFTGYDPGTIVIDTDAHRLYLVESFSTARRYAIAVGREGLQFKGTVAVGDKQEWPRWIPTLDMQKRDPKHYARFKDGMPGGGANPLGARAIYLYDGKTDTHLRIHGTTEPQSIGTNASNGCFRMINEHVMDLYSRVRIGTKVVII
jgi:lipoprotein-anchoring transpeptidase ErfK/SrfK